MATPNFGVYSFDQVSMLFGAVPVDGFGEQGAIRWEADTLVFEDVVGHDGKVMRYKTLDDRALVTVTLLQNSAINDVFSTILNLDKNTPNGAGVVPFLLNDNSGRSIIQAPQCWVRGWPASEYQRKPVDRVWQVRLVSPRIYIGGN